MKHSIKIGVLCLMCGCYSINVSADQAQMNQTLVQVVQQLQQLKPLIAEAAMEEPDNMKSSVHLTAFTGPDGQVQNGVMEDLTALQSGIEQIINQKQIDPRTYAPISGDYLGGE
jgi:RAQPRD family integrative conjugative element protein